MSLLAVRDPAPVVEPASTLTPALLERSARHADARTPPTNRLESTWSLVREPEAGMVQAQVT